MPTESQPFKDAPSRLGPAPASSVPPYDRRNPTAARATRPLAEAGGPEGARSIKRATEVAARTVSRLRAKNGEPRRSRA